MMDQNTQAPISWIWKLDYEIDFEYLESFTRNNIQLVPVEALPSELEIQQGRAEIMGEKVFFAEDFEIHTIHPRGHHELVAGSFQELEELVNDQELFLMGNEGLVTLEIAQVIVTNESIAIIDKLLQPIEVRRFRWSEEIDEDLPAMIKIIEGHEWIYGLDSDGTQMAIWETRRTPQNFEPYQQLK